MIVVQSHPASPDGAGPEGLWPAERLLLAGLRAWGRARVDGAAPQGLVRGGLERVVSPRAAALFIAFMDRMERHARRPLQIHGSSCPGYAADEQRLVVACGLGGVAADLAWRLLAPLVDDPAPLIAIGRALNAALAADGFDLPVRLTGAPADPAPPTLH